MKTEAQEILAQMPVAAKVGAPVAGGAAGLAEWLKAVGINGWSDASAILACAVSLVVIVDYLWRWYRRTRRPPEADTGTE